MIFTAVPPRFFGVVPVVGRFVEPGFRIQRFSGGVEHLDDQFPLGEGYFLPDHLPRFEDDFLKPLSGTCFGVFHKDIVGSGQNSVFMSFAAVPPRFFGVVPVVGRFVEPGFRTQGFPGRIQYVDDQFPLGEGDFLSDGLAGFEDDFLKPLSGTCFGVFHKDIVGSGQNSVFMSFAAVPADFLRIFPVIGRFVEPGFRTQGFPGRIQYVDDQFPLGEGKLFFDMVSLFKGKVE